jgi:spore maturation protein CgeB
MRIMICGPHHADTPVLSLEEMLKGEHDVRVFDPFRNLGLPAFLGGARSFSAAAWSHLLRGVARDPAVIMNRRLIRAAREFQPDVLLVFSVEMLLPETVETLRRETSARIVGWYMDHVANFGRGWFLTADYHALCFVDPYIVRMLRNKAANERVHLVPICCDPALHRPVDLSDAEQRRYGCDLTVAGNLYPYRLRLLEPYIDYDFKIWGYKPRWLRHPLAQRYTGEAVYGVEKSKAMRAAKIVMNTNHYANIAGVNKRTFEVAGSGAFQITDAPGISAVYEPEREIVTFSDAVELKEKVDYYLNHDQERLEIADRAQRRTHAEHTFAQRWEVLLRLAYADPASEDGGLGWQPGGAQRSRGATAGVADAAAPAI